LNAIRQQLRAQQAQRFRIGSGATAVICGTLVLTLASLPWLGWGLLGTGVAAIIAGRPAS